MKQKEVADFDDRHDQYWYLLYCSKSSITITGFIIINATVVAPNNWNDSIPLSVDEHGPRPMDPRPVSGNIPSGPPSQLWGDKSWRKKARCRGREQDW